MARVGERASRELMLAIAARETEGLSAADTAKSVGITQAALARVMGSSEYAVVRAEYEAGLLEGVAARGVGVRAARVAALNDRWLRLHALVDARAADPEAQAVAGGSTGLLIKTWKMGAGKGAFREEWVLDAPLLKELREIEKQAAVELGQWQEQVKQDGKLDINIRYVDDWRSGE